MSIEDVSNKIEVNGVIIANQVIKKYSNKNFNPDYYDLDYAVSEVNVGDILAFGEMETITIESENTLKVDAKSMIQVCSTSEPFMNIDLSEQVIILYLPESVYNFYRQSGSYDKSLQSVFMITFILPTLIVALEAIKSDASAYDDFGWFASMKDILDRKNYRLEDEDTIVVA